MHVLCKFSHHGRVEAGLAPHEGADVVWDAVVVQNAVAEALLQKLAHVLEGQVAQFLPRHAAGQTVDAPVLYK